MPDARFASSADRSRTLIVCSAILFELTQLLTDPPRIVTETFLDAVVNPLRAQLFSITIYKIIWGRLQLHYGVF